MRNDIFNQNNDFTYDAKYNIGKNLYLYIAIEINLFLT